MAGGQLTAAFRADPARAFRHRDALATRQQRLTRGEQALAGPGRLRGLREPGLQKGHGAPYVFKSALSQPRARIMSTMPSPRPRYSATVRQSRRQEAARSRCSRSRRRVWPASAGRLRALEAQLPRQLCDLPLCRAYECRIVLVQPVRTQVQRLQYEIGRLEEPNTARE